MLRFCSREILYVYLTVTLKFAGDLPSIHMLSHAIDLYITDFFFVCDLLHSHLLIYLIYLFFGPLVFENFRLSVFYLLFCLITVSKEQKFSVTKILFLQISPLFAILKSNETDISRTLFQNKFLKT